MNIPYTYQDQDLGYTYGAIRLLESGSLIMFELGLGAYDIQSKCACVLNSRLAD
jgi:hypothetical protein